MKQTKIIHVELREPVVIDGESRKDFYFGSKAAIYGTLSPEQIGITYNYFRSKIRLDIRPYTNSKCTIKQEVLNRKKKTE